MFLIALIFSFSAFSAPMPVPAAMSAQDFKSRAEVLNEFAQSYPSPSIEEFFAARDKDPKLDACRGWLATRMEQYKKAYESADYDTLDRIMETGDGSKGEISFQALERLASRVQLVSRAGIMAAIAPPADPISERSGLLDLMNACGPCLSDVKVENGAMYDSSGWCQVKAADEADGGKILERGTASLKTWGMYPRQKDGKGLKGYNYILAFGQIEDLAPKKPIESGERAVIVVRAFAPLAFGYYGDIFYKPAEENAVKSFTLQFALPEDLKDEDLPGRYSTLKDPVSGATYDVGVLNKEVWGRWFVDHKGVLHYRTRADFKDVTVGFPQPLIDLMKRTAKRVMMDAVWHMYKVVTTKETR